MAKVDFRDSSRVLWSVSPVGVLQSIELVTCHRKNPPLQYRSSTLPTSSVVWEVVSRHSATLVPWWWSLNNETSMTQVP